MPYSAHVRSRKCSARIVSRRRVAQRRQRHREDGRDVEILAEAPIAHAHAQVSLVAVSPTRRWGHREWRERRTCAPPALEQLAAAPPEQPDLVEEDRAAVAAWKRPPWTGGHREGSALEAEHLGLEQRVRDRGAVHAMKSPVGPGSARWILRPGALPAPVSLRSDRRYRRTSCWWVSRRATVSRTALMPWLPRRDPEALHARHLTPAPSAEQLAVQVLTIDP